MTQMERQEQLIQFARRYGYTAGDLLKQAEFMEQYGIVMHRNLCMYQAEELKLVAIEMQNDKT
nr:hypothetical protein [uncultured Blautia sp.]